MMELVVVACLLTAPERCAVHRLQPVEPTSLLQCTMMGQFHLARWAADHPAWRVRRWRCELPAA